MCGIFGIIDQQGNLLNGSEKSILLDQFFKLSESRGKEAAGLAVGTDASISILKHNMRGTHFRKLPRVKQMIRQLNDTHLPHPYILMGHTRMVTNGDAGEVGNNQPVTRDDLACIHNGIITNDTSIWQEETGLDRHYQVDTEVFLALVMNELSRQKPLLQSAINSIQRLQGANSFALMHGRSDGVFLATTNGSLYTVTNHSSSASLFASESYILEKICSKSPIRNYFNPGDIVQLQPGSGMWLSMKGTLKHSFQLDDSKPDIQVFSSDRKMIDLGSTSEIPKKKLIASNFTRIRNLERATAIDFSAIRKLRRCTTCILPETFPFITFDEKGECIFCQNRNETKRPGISALKDTLTNPEGHFLQCLAPISGGRDSCYGLHFMVEELGIRPVTYTYDWGMVTDLARRNISRMCGALGLEHVLISADIARKRNFIRKNVTAWLKRPHLGTVPLFMAGDKQFFYYAEMLRKQMRLDKILFSMNPLERTDFKVGFCGINEGYDKQVHYDPVILNKLRIAFFYGKEYLLNPAYINTSLLDTLGAYASYYILPKKFEQLFDYIPWIENDVENTLIDVYDWEISPDTQSTWRIGDGTAAFYNYIYLRVAGFTENDTFRSNQIREGLVDRQTAMNKIEEENQPRIQSLAWYFDTIDTDAMAAIHRVNSMQRLYET